MKLAFYFEVLIYIFTCITGLFYKSSNINTDMIYVGMLTPFIIPLLFKTLNIKMTYEAKICNLTFVFFASILGSGYKFYRYPLFDKFLHFNSGVLMTVIATLIFCLIKKEKYIKNSNDYKIFLIFINALNTSIAVLWELYEYFMLIFFNNDCINNYTTGVHDSITDMVCAIIGGFLVTNLITRYYKNNKNNFIISLYEGLYDANK